MKKIYFYLFAFISAFVLSACGGGGGSSSSTNSSTTTSAATSTTAYQAGVTIGDNGILEIDREALSYTLTIENSSFSLTGKKFTGRITPNADGGYNIVGSAYARIFVYDNYAVLTLKADKTNPDFAEYFRRNPLITNTVYIPIFALKKDSLITTVDALTANGQSLEFRSAYMGSSVVGAQTNYLAEARLGKITKVSNTQFTVASCSNEGRSDRNSQLTNAYSGSCGRGALTIKTFTYSSADGAWLVTPVDTGYSSQVIRAYFVPDTTTNEVVGYIDTSDSTKRSAGFAIATVVPANTLPPALTDGASVEIVSYQLCISDTNCAETNGVYGIYADTIPFSSSPVTTEIQERSNGRQCLQTSTDNSPANGFVEIVFSPLSAPGSDPCLNAGDRPDTILFGFGLMTQANGKKKSLSVALGYDPTVTPSQKITILNFVEK
jgi:hypothetical protein